jgi:hypothetical protein
VARGLRAAPWSERSIVKTFGPRGTNTWIDFTLEPLAKLPRRALDEQVERVAEILQGTPRLTIGPVSVGAHA